MASAAQTPVVYKCAACGGPASVKQGVIARNCGHDVAGVHALLTATARGVGGVSDCPPARKAALAQVAGWFQRFFKAIDGR